MLLYLWQSWYSNSNRFRSSFLHLIPSVQLFSFLPQILLKSYKTLHQSNFFLPVWLHMHKLSTLTCAPITTTLFAYELICKYKRLATIIVVQEQDNHSETKPHLIFKDCLPRYLLLLFCVSLNEHNYMLTWEFRVVKTKSCHTFSSFGQS